MEMKLKTVKQIIGKIVYNKIFSFVKKLMVMSSNSDNYKKEFLNLKKKIVNKFVNSVIIYTNNIKMFNFVLEYVIDYDLITKLTNNFCNSLFIKLNRTLKVYMNTPYYKRLKINNLKYDMMTDLCLNELNNCSNNPFYNFVEPFIDFPELFIC